MPVLLTVPHPVTLGVRETDRVRLRLTVVVGDAISEAERVILTEIVRVPLTE
jgi:hypothetical protein